MPDVEWPVLHIRFRKHVCLNPGETVRLGRIADLFTDPELEPLFRGLVLDRPEASDGNMILVDMLQVIRQATAVCPSVRIEHYGAPHVLIEMTGKEKSPNWLLVALVWLLLFIGSGLAIMNFHTDVSMLEVHRRIYELLTGTRTEHPYLLQIPYSIGIGVGMVLFFNHLFKKKFNEEPSPLEVEMFLYQENMDQFIIAEEYAKLHGRKESTGDANRCD